MYKNIIVPVALDHPPKASTALKTARALLSEGGKITLLSVMEPVSSYVVNYLPEGQLDKNRAEIEATLARDAAGAADIETKVITGHPGHSIVEFANENGADLIVIASHKPGLQDFFLGSTAARVVRYAKCAVHVLR